MKPLAIAIIGCGTTGLAAALFLQRQNHRITLFEQFSSPRPVGAGILLQPTGLAVLARLGLDEKIIARGARIEQLKGESVKGRIVFDLAYAEYAPHYFGLGVHRGTLFSVLYEEVIRLAVPLVTGFQVADCPGHGVQRYVIDTKGRREGPFDLVIDTSGYKSPLRRYAAVALDKPYPYGAVWGVCEDPNQQFAGHWLAQRYDSAKVMIGVLAIGKKPDSEVPCAAFFWSLPTDSYAAWRAAGIPAWKDKVLRYWPQVEPMIASFKHPDDLTFAAYGDVVLRQWHAPALAFLGDAAHATSPQLGQGSNLGLVDALVLAECLSNETDLANALARYSAMRKRHVRFYQYASRALTPFFQSDSRFAALLRDRVFWPLSLVPFVRRQMIQTLSGVKTGLFSALDPGMWHSRYGIKAPKNG